MINLKKHASIALTYFLLVGFLGIFLRMFFVTPIGANFRYVVHAHSHIALLGWVYIGLTTLIYRLYFLGTNKRRTYLRIFWFTNVTILGMLCSFPFQGYALFSITFSTLFLIASYFLAWFIFKNIPEEYKNSYSYKCIRTALWYMVISSIGPWAIGGVMATLGNTSIWYKLSIYFYLHFQYNAWFILVLCGILFYLLEKFKLKIDRRDFQEFFNNVNAGFILTLFLSALWVKPPMIFYFLGGTGAIFQLLGFWYLFRILKRNWPLLKLKLSPFVGLLLKIAGLFMAAKILMQLFTGLSYFADLSFQFPDFIIGYLHLVFLGIVSICLFAFLKHFRLIRLPKILFWIYFTGFLLSEVLIFYKSLVQWLGLPFFRNYFEWLVAVSALLPISVYFILLFTMTSTSEEIEGPGA